MTLQQWNTSGEIYGTNTATGKKIWLSSTEMNKYWKPDQKGENILLTFLAAQNWRFEKDSIARYKNSSYIQSAELDTLDQLRENILKAGNTQFNISIGTNKYFTDLLGSDTEKLNLKNAGCGLLLKTYQSDIYNNRIKKERMELAQ